MSLIFGELLDSLFTEVGPRVAFRMVSFVFLFSCSLSNVVAVLSSFWAIPLLMVFCLAVPCFYIVISFPSSAPLDLPFLCACAGRGRCGSVVTAFRLHWSRLVRGFLDANWVLDARCRYMVCCLCSVSVLFRDNWMFLPFLSVSPLFATLLSVFACLLHCNLSLPLCCLIDLYCVICPLAENQARRLRHEFLNAVLSQVSSFSASFMGVSVWGWFVPCFRLPGFAALRFGCCVRLFPGLATVFVASILLVVRCVGRRWGGLTPSLAVLWSPGSLETLGLFRCVFLFLFTIFSRLSSFTAFC